MRQGEIEEEREKEGAEDDKGEGGRREKGDLLDSPPSVHFPSHVLSSVAGRRGPDAGGASGDSSIRQAECREAVEDASETCQTQRFCAPDRATVYRNRICIQYFTVQYGQSVQYVPYEPFCMDGPLCQDARISGRLVQSETLHARGIVEMRASTGCIIRVHGVGQQSIDVAISSGLFLWRQRWHWR